MPLTCCSCRTLAFDPCCGACFNCCRRSSSICLICSLMKRRCAISRVSSASVLGGMGHPSGVRSVASRSGALRNFGLKPRMPRRTKAAFIRLTMPVRLPTSCSRSRVGRFASSSSSVGDSGHAAVFLLAAQPTEQRPFEQPNIQPIGLRASPLPGDRNAGRMNDIRFDPSTAQPTRQPEPITTRFKRDDQSGDRVASCNRLIAPAVQQREQSFLVGGQLFQRFSLDTRNHSAYQPSSGTEFDNRYQCLILLKGDEGPAEVIFRLRHGATPSSGCSDDGATPRRPPHSIYSRFSAFWSPADLTDQSLALRKSQNAGSNGRSRASSGTGDCSGLREPPAACRWIDQGASLMVMRGSELPEIQIQVMKPMIAPSEP